MAKRSSDDVLDLLSSMNISLTSKKPVEKRKPLAEPKAAPFELMSQFLFLITENRMKEALQMTDQILELEPRNKTVLQYRTYLRQYIQQGLDVEDEEEEEEEEDEEEEESGEEEDDGDDENENSDQDSDAKGSSSYNESKSSREEKQVYIR